MSKKRRRSKKQSRRNLIAAIIVALIVICSIILVIAFKGEGNFMKEETVPSDTTRKVVTNVTAPYEEPVIVSEPDTTETTEPATEATTASKPSKTPSGKYADTITKIVSHYTSYMSTPKNALFVKEHEITEKDGIVTFTLRMNGESPNVLICDVYVNIATGDVTDSMENEPWNLND